MIDSSFISQNELDEDVSDDYILGFKEIWSECNMKRVRIADLSSNDSMPNDSVYDEWEQRKEKIE